MVCGSDILKCTSDGDHKDKRLTKFIYFKQGKGKAKLYFNDQSQVNQCTLVNKYIYYLQNGHCGRHQKTNLCLFRMSPFMADIINEQKQ